MNIQRAVPLSDKNWFRTGGAAAYYAEPTTEEEFSHAVQYAYAHGLPIVLLGEGANVLIHDEGIAGLVIRPCLSDISVQEKDAHHVEVTAGAGLRFYTLIRWCLDHGYGGLEEFSGIPGTVGGS